MRVSLDTNIWIFGLIGTNEFCQRILLSLARFHIVVPDQIRVELERNLSDFDMKQFYRIALRFGIEIDFAEVPVRYISIFEERGLKKGDAEIGAFCEWRGIDVIVSENRDFLRGLSPGYSFKVMSPQTFCETFGL